MARANVSNVREQDDLAILALAGWTITGQCAFAAAIRESASIATDRDNDSRHRTSWDEWSDSNRTNAMKIYKSKFVAGTWCLKRLYLQVHQPGPLDLLLNYRGRFAADSTVVNSFSFTSHLPPGVDDQSGASPGFFPAGYCTPFHHIAGQHYWYT